MLLSNQLASVKRQLAEKTAVTQAQDAEITRLKMEVDNLNSSLTWHTATLTEMRSGAGKERSQEEREIRERMETLIRVNKALVKMLGEQE